MKKSITKTVIAAVLILGIITLLNACFIVKENEYVTVSRFAKINEIKSEPGLYVKVPFLDTISKLPKNRMVYDLSPSEVFTGDKKTLVVNNYTVWQIDDPKRFVQTITYVSAMEERLNVAVYNAVKNTLGRLDQTDIISAGESRRAAINDEITKQINDQLANYGVSVLGAEIKCLDLPAANEAAVCSRMISEREQMAASFRADGHYEANKIRNETDKDIQIIISEAEAEAQRLRGEGESEYMRILAEGYDTADKEEFYEFLRTLEATKSAMTGEKVLILPKDSPIARAFLGN